MELAVRGAHLRSCAVAIVEDPSVGDARQHRVDRPTARPDDAESRPAGAVCR